MNSLWAENYALGSRLAYSAQEKQNKTAENSISSTYPLIVWDILILCRSHSEISQHDWAEENGRRKYGYVLENSGKHSQSLYPYDLFF